jgi:hypothetical protein
MIPPESAPFWYRIPAGFNAIDWAIANVATLSDAERAELEASSWAKVADAGADVAAAWREEAGAHLLALAEERADPEQAALTSQLLSAQAELVAHLAEFAGDPRFDTVPDDLRPLARALAARTYVRALALAVEP